MIVNQILYVQEIKKTADINSIVKFFCVASIIFGTILVGQGSYAVVKNIALANAYKNNQIIRPEVAMDTDNENVTFTITHDKGIEKIKYNWNNGIVNEVTVNGQTRYSKTITLPTGENTLYIIVIDAEGIQSEYSETFKYQDDPLIYDPNNQNMADKVDPTIELTLSEGGKPPLRIVARDETKIKYMTYKWGDGEEIRIDATEEYFIEKIIEFPEGTNELTVTAVDAAGNKKVEQQTYKTATKPTLIVEQNQSGDTVKLRAIDNVSMVLVELTANGHLFNLRPSEEMKEMQYDLKLPAGTSTIKIIAYNDVRSHGRI